MWILWVLEFKLRNQSLRTLLFKTTTISLSWYLPTTCSFIHPPVPGACFTGNRETWLHHRSPFALCCDLLCAAVDDLMFPLTVSPSAIGVHPLHLPKDITTLSMGHHHSQQNQYTTKQQNYYLWSQLSLHQNSGGLSSHPPHVLSCHSLLGSVQLDLCSHFCTNIVLVEVIIVPLACCFCNKMSETG